MYGFCENSYLKRRHDRDVVPTFADNNRALSCSRYWCINWYDGGINDPITNTRYLLLHSDNENKHYVELAFPLALDKTLTYEVPRALHDRVAVGMRALAPVQSRVKLGIVVKVMGESAVAEPRPIIDLPDDAPIFDDAMLNLCQWIAEYYCCSWGEALACAVPAAIKTGPKIRYHLVTEQVGTGRFSDRQRKIIAALYTRGPLTTGQLAKECGGQSLSNTLNALVKRDVLREERIFRDSEENILKELWVRLIKDAVPDTDELMAMQRRAPKRAAVYLDLLQGEHERAATALYTKHNTNKTVLQALEKAGLVTLYESELYRVPDMKADALAATKHRLNPEQQATYEALCGAVDEKRYATFLLRGITGSGKTEVYLQAIETVLQQGRDAIMLVPEISLTPQTVGRFYARFSQDIAVLHSGLSDGERYDAWRRARQGKVRIVVGARSAVFAPLPDVGIIIVDEEHDNSYKQNETPRYHARDVAIVRARKNRAVCVLGSATPSVESYYNSETQKSTRLELLQRATAGVLPKVHLVDMRREQIENPGQLVLSPILETAIEQRLSAKEQIILLLNRRGFSPVVLCPACGWVAQCEDCQVSLTYHSAGGELRCHYCSATRPKPETCDSCGFNPLVYLGLGTQKAEDYLLRSFSGARIERMDADTTAGKGGHAKILGRFANGEIDILIGTQMLAKGHDYPGVTLVGVINADAGLTLPDFRSAEQAFQLLTQVSGRAGRGSRPGEVYIQTYRPKHYAIAAAAGHDYEGFYGKEIQYRQDAGYPPFRRMVNFMIEASDPMDAERESMRLRRITCEQIDRFGYRGMALLGPAPASIRRMKKMYRWNFAIMSRSASRINDIARAVRETFDASCPKKQVKLKIDLDPYGMF